MPCGAASISASSQYSASTSGMQLKILVFLIKMFLHVPGGEDVVKKQGFFYTFLSSWGFLLL